MAYALLKRFHAPRYWPTWLGIVAFYCFCKLPYSIAIRCSAWLGYHIFKGSRKQKIIRRNIELCFPELSAVEQQVIVDNTLRSMGMSVYELGMAWWASDQAFFSRAKTVGEQHYWDAVAKGKGVLVLAQHFYPLEIGGRLASRVDRLSIMQQIVKNELLSEFRKCKTMRFNDSFPVSAREMLRRIKRKESIIYLPDLNQKAEKWRVFAPFFAVLASTTSATSVFASYSGMPVVPVTFYRDQGQYVMQISPALENYPTGDVTQDATIINQLIEDNVRRHPDQYMWHLKRFKTRPQGEPDLYG